jgi:hypothetical protein
MRNLWRIEVLSCCAGLKKAVASHNAQFAEEFIEIKSGAEMGTLFNKTCRISCHEKSQQTHAETEH